MNPNLLYAQAIKGRYTGRGIGIIDTLHLVEVARAIEVMEKAPGLSAVERKGVVLWFADYLQWMTTDKNGLDEREAKNNHGSWYAAQTASYALFTGDTALAREIADGAKARIGWQITPAGEQPIEMERTRSYHYSGFNIEALSRVAEMGRLVGVDLWRYQAPEGGSLRKALDHVARFLGDPKQWPGKQLDDIEVPSFILVLRRANAAFGEPVYSAALRQIPDDVRARDRSALLYPAAAPRR
jgi:hypothetical protein